MTDRTLLVVLIVVATLAVAPLGAAGAFVEGAPAQEETATPTPTPTPDENQSTNDTTGNDSNASLGASVSAFMQSSAAEAEGEVDRGMFAARFNDSDNETRDELVRDRATVLESRLEELRAEREALLEDEGNTTVAERAKAARLTARIRALQDAANQTDRAAERANVSLNQTRLSALRDAAGRLAGPEIAALAVDIVDRPERGQGPPAAAGNQSNETGNDTDTGPPEDPGADGNQTGDGPPEDTGDEGEGSGNSDAGSDTGSGAGGGNDGADGRDDDA